MKVLVTGTSGQLGFDVMEELTRRGYEAIGADRAETEASFETILFLSKKVDELKLNNVLTIEKSDEKIAKTIIDNTKSKNQKVLSMDSMQATTIEDADQGVSYIDVMTKNLDVLKEALQ